MPTNSPQSGLNLHISTANYWLIWMFSLWLGCQCVWFSHEQFYFHFSDDCNFGGTSDLLLHDWVDFPLSYSTEFNQCSLIIKKSAFERLFWWFFTDLWEIRVHTPVPTHILFVQLSFEANARSDLALGNPENSPQNVMLFEVFGLIPLSTLTPHLMLLFHPWNWRLPAGIQLVRHVNCSGIHCVNVGVICSNC